MAVDIKFTKGPGGYYNSVTGAGPYAADDAGSMTLIGSGSGGTGGGGGLTNTELRDSPIPVNGTVTATGPLTNAQLLAVTGAANAPMWDGEAASATLISILKNMQEQGEALKRIGNETNTLMVQVAEHTRQIAVNTAQPEA